MSLFNSIAQLQLHVRGEKAVLLLSDAGAQRSCFGKSSSGINHIQAFVSTFVLVKKTKSSGLPPELFNCPVKQSQRVGINRQKEARETSNLATWKRRYDGTCWGCGVKIEKERQTGRDWVSLCFVLGAKLPAAGSSELSRLPRL